MPYRPLSLVFLLLACSPASLPRKHEATMFHPPLTSAPSRLGLPAGPVAVAPSTFPCELLARLVEPPIVVALMRGCFASVGRFVAVAFPPNQSRRAGELAAQFIRQQLGSGQKVAFWQQASAMAGEKQTMVILVLKVLE